MRAITVNGTRCRAARRWGRILAARPGAVLAAALMAVAVSPVSAQIALTIADPVLDDLRARVADLLRSMRPADPDIALDATRIIDDHGLWREHGTLILRVEANCRDGLCMTVIAQVTESGLVSQVTLNADNLVAFTDYSFPLWGEGAYPIHIKGAGSTGTVLWLRQGSWVVEACGDCFMSAEERAKRPSPPPSPPQPSPTFEEFRRSLGLDP
ncbi:hypothetical protein [Methylobacterium tarhaniae]|nr:hypothetical protein [Methylobacterium tarhaniae]